MANESETARTLELVGREFEMRSQAVTARTLLLRASAALAAKAEAMVGDSGADHALASDLLLASGQAFKDALADL